MKKRLFASAAFLLLFTVAASAARDSGFTFGESHDAPCNLEQVTHDWDSSGSHGFEEVLSDNSGAATRQHGATVQVPAAPVGLWEAAFATAYVDQAVTLAFDLGSNVNVTVGDPYAATVKIGDSSPWSDDFEAYPVGPLVGSGGWEWWDGNPAADANVVADPAFGTRAVEILPTTDVVHQLTASTGVWVMQGRCYIPSGSTGEQYFILLNTYDQGGPYNWSLQLVFDSDLGTVGANEGTASTTIINDAWIEVRVEIDLDADTQSIYYNGALLETLPWSGTGVAAIAAVDFFSNGGSSIYWDCLCLLPPFTTCPCEGLDQCTDTAELAVNGLIEADVWGDWFGPESEVPVRLLAGCCRGSDGARGRSTTAASTSIDSVRFFYSTDGGAIWNYAGSDNAGDETAYATVDTLTPVSTGDGWSTIVDLTPTPTTATLVKFKAFAHLADGDSLEVVVEYSYDPHPPSLANIELLGEPTAAPTDTVFTYAWIDPTSVEIDSVYVWVDTKRTNFSMGVPGINQRSHSDGHCAPTASAQTLKYYEQALGDHELTAGLNHSLLVDSLAVHMGTSTEWGTSLSCWLGGFIRWIRDRGDNYNLRFNQYHGSDGSSSWTHDDWVQTRDDLESGQSILTAVFWAPSHRGAHAMTLDRVINNLSSGMTVIGFMDPWEGAAADGDLYLDNGHIHGGTNVPNKPESDVNLTITMQRKWDSVADGGPGVRVWRGVNPWPSWIRIPLTADTSFVHFDILNDQGHLYRDTRIVSRDELIDVADEAGTLPKYFRLSQSNPNPFRATTVIPYAVSTRDHVRLAIYDVTGRTVRTLIDRTVEPGYHTVVWDGRNESRQRVVSGVYYISMRSTIYEKTRTVILLR